MSPLRAQQVNAIYRFVTMYINITITILDIITVLSLILLFKTRRFGEWILSPYSGGTCSFGPYKLS
jgi:hypothetical protein